ncbi:hypothetical protein VTK73DRAFT_2447 [Phialemonium thermophilum]|uniref:Major facilitator superfamily (MFS) profile domain-containing protein n=1 Tax=Phialemonium thermophilum TaxID=223376 RepID=A0ABR3VS37_9PEZI
MGASTFLRDTPLGQGIRFVSRSRLLQYPEERHDFKLPDSFPPAVLEASADASCPEPPFHDREKGGTRGTTPEDASSPGSQSPLPRSDRRPDEPILVGWYGPDDPENPRNWSWRRKLYVHLSINIYTFGVYMASSIFTPVIPEVIRIYGIDRVTASLGIGLYTLGYGLGPLALSPPSEIAAVGRNPVYVATMVVFVLLSVGAALVDNVPGLMVLRFLQGFFCAPGLANGGGSIGDVTSPLLLPYALYLWAFFPLGGPSLGPMIAGFSVAAENWRWALWEIVWIASFSLVNLVSRGRTDPRGQRRRPPPTFCVQRISNGRLSLLSLGNPPRSSSPRRRPRTSCTVAPPGCAR